MEDRHEQITPNEMFGLEAIILPRNRPVCTENLMRIDCVTESPNVTSAAMIALLCFFLTLLMSFPKISSGLGGQAPGGSRSCSGHELSRSDPGHPSFQGCPA
jgi:hypothetical protein